MHLLSLQFLTYEDFNPFMDVVLRHHVGLEFLAGVNSYWGGCMREVWHSVQGRGIIVRGFFLCQGIFSFKRCATVWGWSFWQL